MVSLSTYLLAFVLPVSLAFAKSTNAPVCIVGAGPAGLAAAKALEDKGKDVVVFEKKATVGGKCQAVYKDGFFHPLGAVLFEKAAYVETVKLIEQTGVPYSNLSSGERWYFDWKTGTAAQAPPTPQDVATALVLEYQRYAEFWNTVYRPSSVSGYKNGVPPELAVPGAQWLAQNGYQILGLAMVDAFVTYGYGDYREVPALYVLEFFTPSILEYLLGLTPGYKIDFHKLFVEFSKSIKGQIHLSTNVILISRWRLPIIIYRKGHDWLPRIQTCSDLILAFPPTLEALEGAGLTLSREEEDLFSAVRVVNYFSSAVKMRQLPGNVSFSPLKTDPFTPVAPEGQPVFFTALHPDSGVTNVWSWDADNARNDIGKVRRLLTQTLSKYNKDPKDSAQKPTPVKDKDVIGFSAVTDYFPHVGPAELDGGWYARLNALMGTSHTYYASGLNSFETVEFALRAGQDIVGSYL